MPRLGELKNSRRVIIQCANHARRIGALFGVSDVQLMVTTAAPRICIPVSDSPVVLLIGNELPNVTDEAERSFLFARALKAAATKFTFAMRTTPDQFTLALAAFIRSFDEQYSLPAARPEPTRRHDTTRVACNAAAAARPVEHPGPRDGRKHRLRADAGPGCRGSTRRPRGAARAGWACRRRSALL